MKWKYKGHRNRNKKVNEYGDRWENNEKMEQ